MTVLLSREQRTNWKKWRTVNREVAETLGIAVQSGAPPEVLAAVQTGGVDLGSQWTGPDLTEALVGRRFPAREAIRSSLLLLGWHQVLGMKHADTEYYEEALQASLEPKDFPYLVDDLDRRNREIDSYVAFTGANRGLIVDATKRFLELTHGADPSSSNYPVWRYRVVRGMLTATDWQDARDFIEQMKGATFAAALMGDLHAFFDNLVFRPNHVVTDWVDATALCRYWFDFVAQRNALT